MAFETFPPDFIAGLGLDNLAASAKSTSADFAAQVNPENRVASVDQIETYVSNQIGGTITEGPGIDITSGKHSLDLSSDSDVNLEYSGSGDARQLRVKNILTDSSGNEVLNLDNSTFSDASGSGDFKFNANGPVLETGSGTLAFDGSQLTANNGLYIQGAGSGGTIYLDASNISLSSPDASDYLDLTNGSIYIYTDNSTRLAITDSGVQFGGTGATIASFETSVSNSDTQSVTGSAVYNALGSATQLTDSTHLTAGAGTFTIKDSVVSNDMLSGSIADDKLASQYLYADGSRALSGDQSAGSNKITNLANPTAAADAANKAYVDQAVAGLDFQADVLNVQVDNTLDPGASPTSGDRYIITDSTNLHANFGTITGVANGDIVSYNGTAFEIAYDVSDEGEGALVWDRNGDRFMKWDGSSWSEFGGLAGITAGDGLIKSGSTLHVQADDTTIEIVSDTLQVKASGIGTSHIAAEAVTAAKIDPLGDYTMNSLSAAVTGTLSGDVTGNVTGNVIGNASTATALATARDISISGDVTASAVSFDGSGNVVLSAAITAGSIVFADLASAAIETDISNDSADKLARADAVYDYVGGQIYDRFVSISNGVSPNEAVNGSTRVFTFTTGVHREKINVLYAGKPLVAQARTDSNDPDSGYEVAAQSNGTTVTLTFRVGDEPLNGKHLSISGVTHTPA